MERGKAKKIYYIASVATVLVAVVFVWFFLLKEKGIDDKLVLQGFAAGSIDKTYKELLAQANEVIVSANPSPDGYCCLQDYSKARDVFVEEQISFLEINLEEKRISAFENGEFKKDFSILAIGEPQAWGGTASGVYKIESGHKSAFSGIAGAYMPFALKFYGKYYIHGEPYYTDGRIYTYENTGGCLRIKDEDAEELYNFTAINMPVLVVDKKNDNYQYEEKETSSFPLVSAESYLVADLGSGVVLAEKETDKIHQIASITKWMTALVVVENIGLKRTVEVVPSMLENGYGECDVLTEGTRYRVVEVLYPLLMESSNDAAFILAGFLGLDKTIELMNEKAEALLMPDTKFTDPSGYDAGNVSTAKDLFYLARYILNNRPPLLSIGLGQEVPSFGGVSFDFTKLWNKNIFNTDDTFIGGKTGYITSSGYNGVFIFKMTDANNQKRDIAIITLGSICMQCRKTDVQKIYIWLMKNYFRMK